MQIQSAQFSYANYANSFRVIQLCKFNRARINYANYANSISIIRNLNNSSGSTSLEAAHRLFPAVPLGAPVSLALALAPFRKRRSWGRASDRASKQQTHFGQQCWNKLLLLLSSESDMHLRQTGEGKPQTCGRIPRGQLFIRNWCPRLVFCSSHGRQTNYCASIDFVHWFPAEKNEIMQITSHDGAKQNWQIKANELRQSARKCAKKSRLSPAWCLLTFRVFTRAFVIMLFTLE